MNNLRVLLGIGRMDCVLNAWIGELCGMTRGLDDRINDSILCWFGHVERMEKDMIVKRVYEGECAVIHSVGRLQKRWIDIIKGVFKEKGCQASKENCVLYDEMPQLYEVRQWPSLQLKGYKG